MTADDTSHVREYYERHTGAFVAFGQGGSLGALHRAVWGPGVSSRAAAFRYVEDEIARVARGLPAPGTACRLIDVGCGVGGSLCYLARQLPITGIGVTVSPTQAALARRRIAEAGLSDRLTIVEGDFAEVPAATGAADLVFAIESFVHATDVPRFFGECRRLVRPGGVLMICDDFRRRMADGHGEARAAIDRFRRGWHVNALLESEELRAHATAADFVHESTEDLSAYVETGRWRDRIIDRLTAPLQRLPWRWPRLDPWLGGSALQHCLRQGWIGYDLVVFRRGITRI